MSSKERKPTVEPRYRTLAELKADKGIPAGIRPLVYDVHVSLRNPIAGALGAIELAYGRGYLAGQEDARKGKWMRKVE